MILILFLSKLDYFPNSLMFLLFLVFVCIFYFSTIICVLAYSTCHLVAILGQISPNLHYTFFFKDNGKILLYVDILNLVWSLHSWTSYLQFIVVGIYVQCVCILAYSTCHTLPILKQSVQSWLHISFCKKWLDVLVDICTRQYSQITIGMWSKSFVNFSQLHV